MTEKTLKTLVFSLVLAALTLTANSATAQQRGGALGRGFMPETELQSGLLGSGLQPGYNLSNQTFGLDAAGGYLLVNQFFGQETPVGSGLAILVVAGMGYAAAKSRKKNQKSNK